MGSPSSAAGVRSRTQRLHFVQCELRPTLPIERHSPAPTPPGEFRHVHIDFADVKAFGQELLKLLCGSLQPLPVGVIQLLRVGGSVLEEQPLVECVPGETEYPTCWPG